jgi:nucleotidyltransferase substrate binding protein (TIGR01987 family)
MNTIRIKELSRDFKQTLAALEKALNKNPDKHSLFRDATILRFQVTFELAWKLLKGILHSQGVDVEGLKEVIHESINLNLIKNESLWVEMLNDRDRASRVYSEKEIQVIYTHIRELYFPALQIWQSNAVKEGLTETETK